MGLPRGVMEHRIFNSVGVDANARPKFKIVTDDKLIAKLCHMVIHYQWFTSTGILSMVLIYVNTNMRLNFKVGWYRR